MRSVTRAHWGARPILAILVVTVAVAALLAPPAFGAPPPPVYTAQPLPVPLDPSEVLQAWSTANDINSRGEVVGTASVHALKAVALKWSASGQPTVLSARPYTTASAINERGDVIGSSREGDTSKAAIWLRNGTEVIVEPQAPATGTIAVDINDRGQVLVVSVIPFPAFPAVFEQVRAHIYHRGTLTEVTGLPETDAFPAGALQLIGLDRSGRVYGNRLVSDIPGGRSEAFVWSDGQTDPLGSLGGASSRITAVNKQGHVTGSSTRADGTSPAFLWREGVMTDLGTLGGHTGRGIAVNEIGQVTGMSSGPDFRERAFFWSPGRGMVEIPPLDGVSTVEPAAINNRGQVVGSGWNNGRQAFVWHRGSLTQFTWSPGDGEATAINKHGVVVGWQRPFLILAFATPMRWSPGPPG